jgi:hypothetical protein
MGKRQRELAEDILAGECEAYLNGALAEYLEERGTSVPVWTWTNLLAHGNASQIAESVHHAPRPRRTGRSWRIARAYVAYEMLDGIARGSSLEELQSAVLLPLERELASDPDVERWTPRRWVDAVGQSIRNEYPALGL